ncbi:hypothetical protein V6N12_049438 [Hibiscus sabdariffa]|uniref:Uncharacterized protein n=1 Tax=Hibiscus sabdariffa TaxID=183260 RepID=A0ABR2CBQ6_9ROSI
MGGMGKQLWWPTPSTSRSSSNISIAVHGSPSHNNRCRELVKEKNGSGHQPRFQRYLTELICKGLLQVVSRNESGRPKEYKMHDILREFAVSISKSIKFVAKYDGAKEVEDSGCEEENHPSIGNAWM